MSLFRPTSSFFTRIATLYQEWFVPNDAPRPVLPLADPTPALSEKLREWEASVMESRGPGAGGPYKKDLTFYARERDTVEVMAKLVFVNVGQSDVQWRAMMCSRAELPRSVAQELGPDGIRTYLWPSSV